MTSELTEGQRIALAWQSQLKDPSCVDELAGQIDRGISDEVAEIADVRDLGNEAAIGTLNYKGNSVSWWWSKAKNYTAAITRACQSLSATGFWFDGQTELADGITKHFQSILKDRDELRGTLAAVFKELEYDPGNWNLLREQVKAKLEQQPTKGSS